MDIREASQILAELGDDPEFLERELQRHDPVYEELIGRAEIQPGSKVLELGCGTGAVAVKLAQRMGPKGEVLGIDVNRRMLKVAEAKKRRLGLSNVEFRLMNMEKPKLPDNKFDHVVSSFGICCCFYYDRTLRGSYRVLKLGGRLTFNQNGPHQADAEQLLEKVFSKYGTKKPSGILAKKIQANSLHECMTSKYQGSHQDPFAVLALMEEAGFRDVECAIKYFRLTFHTPDEFIDYSLFNSLGFGELSPRRQDEFRKECASALKAAVMTDKGLVNTQEVVYFTGFK